MIYRRIVLAADPEGLAESALPVAAALAAPGGAKVFAVLVWDEHRPAETRRAAEAELTRMAAELRAAGVAIESEIREAAGKSAAAELILAATDLDADLLIMGSHGHHDTVALLEGSVAWEVASQIDRPVVLVHGRRGLAPVTGSVRRVLVAVDFGQESAQAASYACDLAMSEKAQLLVLHVREMVPFGDPPYIEDESEAAGLVEGVVAKLRSVGCELATMTTRPESNIAKAIADEAERWQADLVVLGSRRQSVVGGLLLGSTAHGVVRRSSRPVLLVGRPGLSAGRRETRIESGT